ncbi:N-acetyltransferase family 8 member 3 [Periophthalmus magnuspinnatus]|uniref:N-acetyltransferase family 8 member 3 n=1 Tax=Periophthalmus magnuspinnatus TaxID=409849 RepID=UPI0024372E30|nr:N-acetyltransferase family 8 member 3 [Periophthalmus magnuspinnatus]
MAPKNNIPFSIRKYAPSDQPAVMSLFRDGIMEHVYPAFFKTLSHPDHIGIALSISMAGYVLGGSSYFQAFLFGSAWAGLLYYCCNEIYEGYMEQRMAADMANVQTSYLDNPDSAFWVAETEVKGQQKSVGIAAVIGKRSEVEGERFDDWNGGVIGEESEFGQDAGSYGELMHLVVAFPWRRNYFGSEMMQKVMDFCKERGYSRVVLDVSSSQTAAIALFQKFGFVQTASHNNTHSNRWFSRLARINMLRMEKVI